MDNSDLRLLLRLFGVCCLYLVIMKMMTMMMVTIMIIFDTIARSFTETLQLAMF